MITYIYHKDSTLWAFEGPEEPHCLDDAIDWKKYGKDMFTARESALPVVNIMDFWKETDSYAEGRDVKDWLKPGETIALPGWGLEVVMSDGWQPTYNNPDNSGCDQPAEPEAYRLVRSEPEREDGNLMGTQPFVNQDYGGDSIPLISTVEPSESQEEMWAEFEKEFVQKSIIRIGVKQIIAELSQKFTITRK